MTDLDRPIFVVAPPESGAGRVHAALAAAPGVWELGPAGRAVLDRSVAADPEAGDRRAPEDATPAEVERVRDELKALREASGRRGRPLDGAPRNSLRVGFLAAIFPAARFVYVYRDPRETIAAIDAAWHSGAYVSHPDLPGWQGPPWSLVLVPHWRELAGATVTRIAAAQWAACTRTALDELERLAPTRWSVIDHATLDHDPEAVFADLCEFVGVAAVPAPPPARDRAGHANLPRVSESLEELLANSIGLAERARDLIAEPRSRRPTPGAGAESGLASSHSPGFERLLDRSGGSLLAAGTSPGKLVLITAGGPRLETLFRDLPDARAVATTGSGFAAAGASEARIYRLAEGNGPPSGPKPPLYAVAERRVLELEPCDLAADGERLLIASAERILALDADGESSELWRVPTASPARGARLTGLAVAAGAPAIATAQPGPFDTRAGLALELGSGELIELDLRSPRAPRWHQGRLWALDAASGTLGVVDLDRGGFEPVAAVSGFATALALTGELAFVATSGDAERGAAIWAIETAGGATLGRLGFAREPAAIGGLAFLAGVNRAGIAATPSSTLAGS